MSLVFDDDSALLLGINDLTRCLRLHHFCLYPVILFGRLRQSWGVFGTWRGAGWEARIWTSVPNFYIDLIDLLRNRFWSSLIQPALSDFGIHWFSRNWFIILEAGVIIHLELWYLLERLKRYNKKVIAPTAISDYTWTWFPFYLKDINNIEKCF